MITLYAFGSAFGLPDFSPFVTKVEMLLKLSGLDYEVDTGGLSKAPKGKLPYIVDDSEIIADSTFIRWHLEEKYGIDFDPGLDATERATAWAFEKMFEDHAYWTVLHARWVDDRNFSEGVRVYFQRLPMPLRLIIERAARRQIKAQIKGHGMGRHSVEEIVALGSRSLAAVADFLGRKPYMMGYRVTGLDATAYAFLIGAMCPVFETPLRTEVERHDNLKAYVARMTEEYFPQNTEIFRWAA